jgi:hypothetical protein
MRGRRRRRPRPEPPLPPFFPAGRPPAQLWHAYLLERREAVRGLSPAHPGIEALGNVYERALVSMHKMPRVWLEYLEFLVEQVGTDPSWEGSGSRSGAAG